MNLQETIDALDQHAARYTEAANALRALLGQEGSLSVPPLEATPEADEATSDETDEATPETDAGIDTGAEAVEEEVEAAPAPRRRGRKPGRKPKAGSKSGKGRGNRGPVSAETRAKISEALRASHAERRALAQKAAGSTD